MLPVRQAGQDDAIEVARGSASKDSGSIGGAAGNWRFTSPGSVRAITGSVATRGAIVGDPVDQAMTRGAEFFRRHDSAFYPGWTRCT